MSLHRTSTDSCPVVAIARATRLAISLAAYFTRSLSCHHRPRLHLHVVNTPAGIVRTESLYVTTNLTNQNNTINRKNDINSFWIILLLLLAVRSSSFSPTRQLDTVVVSTKNCRHSIYCFYAARLDEICSSSGVVPSSSYMMMQPIANYLWRTCSDFCNGSPCKQIGEMDAGIHDVDSREGSASSSEDDAIIWFEKRGRIK